MRGTLVRLARGPGKEPVPFKPVGTLSLEDKITDKKDRHGALVCVQEMQTMFACWKKFDYDESKCGKELTLFQKCHKSYMEERDSYQHRSPDSVLGHDSGRRLGVRQANVLLKQYPNPR